MRDRARPEQVDKGNLRSDKRIVEWRLVPLVERSYIPAFPIVPSLRWRLGRQRTVDGKVFGVEVVGRLVGRLPRRCAKTVRDCQQDVRSEDENQEPASHVTPTRVG